MLCNHIVVKDQSLRRKASSGTNMFSHLYPLVTHLSVCLLDDYMMSLARPYYLLLYEEVVHKGLRYLSDNYRIHAPLDGC